MPRPKEARPERTAGAFLGPDLLMPVPLRTLDQEYRDEPAEPKDSDHEPAPQLRSRLRRAIDKLTGQSRNR